MSETATNQDTAAPADRVIGAEPGENERQLKQIMIIAAVVTIIILLAVIAAVALAVAAPDRVGPTFAVVRDIFIITLALEALIIVAALAVLLVQVSRLVNLLQNEIKPMLEATQQTLNTVRGTTVFLAEHAAEPVIQANSYVAGVRSVIKDLTSVGRDLSTISRSIRGRRGKE